MDADFQQKMAIVSGANIPARQGQKLSETQKKEIAKNYFKLFFALSMTNWMANNTLGASWHKAMSQMDAYTSAKNTNNPVAMYIKQLHVAHKTKWNHIMMTHKLRDKKLNISPDVAKKWNMRVATNVREGLNGLNAELNKFQAPPQKQQAKQPTMSPEMQKRMQMWLLQQRMQNQNQRSA